MSHEFDFENPLIFDTEIRRFPRLISETLQIILSQTLNTNVEMDVFTNAYDNVSYKIKKY